MPVPKRKTSRSRRDKRQANKGLKAQAFTFCSNCSEPLMTHQACLKCGFYKGEKVLVTKLDRGIKRKQERQAIAERRAKKEEAQNAQGASDKV
jgi:large subunit ribosomal protein L32